MRLRRLAIMLGVVACGPGSTAESAPAAAPTNLLASARTMYERYVAALTTPQREAIAGFYHRDGAVRVINGVANRRTRAALDSSYRGPWTPPQFFAWDSLAFDSLGPGQVLVTGRFRWLAAGSRDTVPWIYAAVLQPSDSGLGIVFEHETPYATVK